MSSAYEALDASASQLGALDRAARRLVDLLEVQARVAAAITIQLAQCAQVAHEIGVLDSHPKNQDFVNAMVASEVGARARINDRAMEAMIGEAHDLVTEYPKVVDALADARISPAHVRVIQRAGTPIMDPALRAGYETAVLEHAVKETTNRLRPIAKRLAEQFTTATLEERHAREKQRRFVEVTSLGDGMAELYALLPATEAFAIKDRLSKIAHLTQDPSRSIPELRADILTDLLLCSSPTPGVHGEPQLDAACPSQTETFSPPGGLRNIQAQVMVIIPLMALLPPDRARALAGVLDLGDIAGLHGSPELVGHGPIDLETARLLAGSATGWDRVMVHPITGALDRVDRYRPSQEQRRTLAARDMHCRFPGCRISVPRCDLDHTIAAEHGGPTANCNLAHMCRRHHSLKHHGRWEVEQLDDGILRWISPNGYVYLEEPPSTAMFKPINTAMSNPFGEIPPF